MRKTTVARAAAWVVGGVALMGSLPAWAQDAGQQDQPQRVEITGSSIKRVDAETSLPVTVMKRDEIERTGATTAQDLVSLIPSNFGGTVMANNVGYTGAASTANLRSLGAKYTLVLLNGRRVANYAFGNSPVDLNSIPISAVERVEVLRDGASAIYGADAVAGVINFILRKDYQGIEASVYDTHVQHGGGNTKSVNVTGGFGSLDKEGFNVLLSANHEEDEALKATQRSFAASAVRPDLGINNSSSRNGIPNLSFTDTMGNPYGTQDASGKTPAVNPYRYKGCDYPQYALAIIDDTECGTDYVKFIDLLPEARHDNVVARGVFKVNEDLQLHLEGTYTKDHLVATYSPAPYTRPMTYPANGRFYPTTITLPKGMTLPAGYVMPDGSVLAQDTVLTDDMAVTPTGPISGTWRTVAGGGRQDITDTDNTRILFGAEGTLAGWDYDTAFTYSRNHGEISFGNGQYGYTALAPLLAAGKINVFGDQDQQSLGDLASAALHGAENSATATSQEFDIHVSREVGHLAHGPVGLAIGGSIRKETLEQVSEPVLASGDQVGGNGPVPGVSGNRKVYGLFSEVQVPLYDHLDLDVAARYDNYKNSFGTSFNKLSPKASIRFQPMKELVLRASYGQGYRAPTLYENLLPFTSGNNTNANWSDPIRCPNGTPITGVSNPVVPGSECRIQLPAAFSGNLDLKPEQSKQYSLGIVFSPTASLSGSLDYWDVRISDAIQRKSEVAVLSNEALYRDNYYFRYDPHDPANWCDPTDPTSADATCVTNAIKGSADTNLPLAYVYLPYENTAKVFSAGVDVNLNYRLKTGIGSFTTNLDGTYFTKHGYQYNGVAQVSDLGAYKDFQPVPRWRHALTFVWAQGPWNASLTHNYTAGYQDYFDPTQTPGPDYPADRKVDAYQTVDVTAGWSGFKGLELVLGVKNLLDQDPPSSRTGQNFQVGYDATYTNPLGRTYYLRARYKFF